MASSENPPSARPHVLTFTSLYPNQGQPRHGIFVENRMKELVKQHPVDLTVVAPVPWFPFKGKRFGQYGIFASIPKKEIRHNITVHHPRYLVIPKIGMNLAPLLMALSLYPFIKRLHKTHSFDLIDGHFIYPDGVVATLFGKLLKLPVINTARGNDITLYPNYALPKKMIIWAIENSNAVISVCKFLSDEIKNLGASQENNLVMRNSVDLELFKETAREKTRNELGLTSFTLISVGHFIERKGHHLIIEALQQLPDSKLLLVGDGELNDQLMQQVKILNLSDRVIFTGPIPQSELSRYYSAADCMVLASSREGWANVLLESMACGTPVVATKVSGTPEVVLNQTAGQLIEERSANDIVKGTKKLLSSYPERAKVRQYAEQFDWSETTENLYSLLNKIVD